MITDKFNTMSYHPSRDAIDSLMRLGEKIASDARKDREAKRIVRERETALLIDFNKSKAKRINKPASKGKAVWLDAQSSFRLAENARDMFAAGKTKAQVCEALEVPYRLLTYHLEKHGMKGAETNAKLAVRSFTLSAEARALCDQMRPATSWDDLAARLGINRSTLIKHYMREAGAKRGGRCNARTAVKKAA